MDAKQAGECIRRNMNKKNMSTAMLSEITGISEERLKEYIEGNLTNKAKYGEIMAISNAIEVPPLMLLHGGGQWHKYGKDEDGRPFSEWIEY